LTAALFRRLRAAVGTIPPAVAAVLAGVAAGPWPGLPAASLLWRSPLVVLGIAALWPRCRRGRWAVAAIALAALAIDALVPSHVVPERLAAAASAKLLVVQRCLETLANRPALRAALEAGGSEAAPEAPFAELRRGAAEGGLAVDALLLVDERGTPIAWTGERAQMPFRLRLLGERAVAAEPGVSEAWVWWREPVLDSGRTIGELLAGVVLPEAGSGSVLGVGAGRAAVVVPRWEGGATVVSPIGGRLMGIDTLPSRPVLWSTPAGAAVLISLVLALGATGWARWALVSAGIVAAIAGAGADVRWSAILVLLGLGVARRFVGSLLPTTGVHSRAGFRVTALLTAAGAVWLTWLGVGMLSSYRLDAAPDGLLPAPWQLALALAWTLVFVSAAPAGHGPRRPLRALAWVPLVVGTLLGHPGLIAGGAGAVALIGLPASSVVLPGVAAALVIVGSNDAARRAALTTAVESTLARLTSEQPPATAILAAFPESGLAELVRLSPGEMVVVLGRVAGWMGFSDALPGGSLAVIDPGGAMVAVWGQHLGGWGGAPRELDTRELAGGWRLSVLTAEQPYNVLAALAAAGVTSPTAAIDRSGAPVTRGATFRPLPPERVGRALAEERSWSRVLVGEREYRAYLRGYAGWVVAVPWVRAPLPELGLSLAGLSLWGAFPFAAWRHRRWVRGAWEQRRTFSGRLRVLSAAATLVPLLLLAQLLPRQWASQQRLARLELGRAFSQPLAVAGIDQQLPWLVRDMGATVALYRDGRLVRCSRPDLVAAGAVPWLAPEEAFVRAVRGWREPLVLGDSRLSIFAPLATGQVAEVGAILDLQVARGLQPSSPREWFVITGVWAAVLALATAGWVGGRLARPLQTLVEATQRLERGESVAGLPVQRDTELATLMRAFQAMASTVQRREEELRRERDLLDSVLGTLSAAVVVLDASGESDLANASARRLLGDGAPVPALTRQFGPAVERLLGRAAAGETGVETVHPPVASEALWQVTVMPLAGMGGRRLVVMEDLSEVARAERLASLAELARIVAHEVKNPLTPIRLWAEELQAALDAGGARVTEIARTAAEQILERVAHLREVAQGFSNLVALEHWEAMPVDLEPLLRRVVDEYAVVAHRGVAIRCAVSGGGRVTADASWVERAVRHLLDNSLRAVGGRDGEVEVTASEERGEIVVRVRDSGGGVPAANLRRLFEPHFSTTGQGSGLGLAVVRRVMERAGGRAEAFNAERGLEVALFFPRSAAPGSTV
jgi:signal transduction histidine kinase/HAMP domain-containing protein